MTVIINRLVSGLVLMASAALAQADNGLSVE